MHAGACPFGIGLGHESGDEAVLFGCRLDDALQHDGFIAGFQHIVAMAQHDLHLARCIFGDQSLGRQVLHFAPGIKVLEKRGEIIRVLKMIGLVVLRPRLINECLRRLRFSFQRRLAIQQEEFQFNSAHGEHVEVGLETVDDAFKGIARIGIVLLALKVMQLGDILGGGHIDPWHAVHGAGHGPEQQVAVAFIENKACFGHVLPRDIQHGSRDGQEAAILPAGHHFITAQNLAADNAARICPDNVDAFNVGIGIQESLGFGPKARSDIGRHFFLPFPPLAETRQLASSAGSGPAMEQFIDVLVFRCRANEHHIVEWRDHHAAVQEIVMHRPVNGLVNHL